MIFRFIKKLLNNHKSYQNWYFETSSVNYLLDNIFSKKEFSSIKTRKLQLRKKRKWYISNITLWEIFLTGNENRRTELFDFSRSLFHKELMPSIEELLINYIKNGLPTIEQRYKLKSKSIFSKHWKKACKNSLYFFEPNINDLKTHTSYYRFLGEYFVQTNKGYVLDFDVNISVEGKEYEMKKIENAFTNYKTKIGNEKYKKYEQHYNLSFQLVLIIFCYGINFNQEITENYWRKIGINNPNERIDYVVKNMLELFYRGPISNVAQMILLQANTNSTRGVYFDALHSAYITYSDLYFSDDSHFESLKTINDPNMLKIRKVSEMEFS